MDNEESLIREICKLLTSPFLGMEAKATPVFREKLAHNYFFAVFFCV